MCVCVSAAQKEKYFRREGRVPLGLQSFFASSVVTGALGLDRGLFAQEMLPLTGLIISHHNAQMWYGVLMTCFCGKII